ncbi:hypothetical protein E2C01_032176 [Portunus trituberculatus]|uniref:Uncharacterized protein n=1 Tax=Portunus trituberculatus TaxID=210409 RepID=A0A5B7EZ02_PORTR|nr:hypothetical protein [Portunus trituberculatus]
MKRKNNRNPDETKRESSHKHNYEASGKTHYTKLEECEPQRRSAQEGDRQQVEGGKERGRVGKGEGHEPKVVR